MSIVLGCGKVRKRRLKVFSGTGGPETGSGKVLTWRRGENITAARPEKVY
jgi:hypothetical protein